MPFVRRSSSTQAAACRFPSVHPLFVSSSSESSEGEGEGPSLGRPEAWMELNEAARRIVWRHGALILAFVLMGGVITAALHLRDQTTYTATSRLVLDTSDPQSSAESVAIADTARAIATSPN